MSRSGVNPWTTVAIAIASLDYVKRPEVRAGPGRPAGGTWSSWTRRTAPGPAAIDSRPFKPSAAGRRTSCCSPRRPHSGSRPAFDALCEVGAHGGDRLLIFRRTRQQVALGAGRRVHRVLVEPSAAERQVYSRLADVAGAVASERESSRDAWLSVAVFQKRAFSSTFALAQTVGPTARRDGTRGFGNGPALTAARGCRRARSGGRGARVAFTGAGRCPRPNACC